MTLKFSFHETAFPSFESTALLIASEFVLIQAKDGQLGEMHIRQDTLRCRAVYKESISVSKLYSHKSIDINLSTDPIFAEAYMTGMFFQKTE